MPADQLELIRDWVPVAGCAGFLWWTSLDFPVGLELFPACTVPSRLGRMEIIILQTIYIFSYIDVNFLVDILSRKGQK